MNNIGFTLHSGDFTIKDILNIVKNAEELGYDGFWLAEESGKEAFQVLALSASITKRIKLGTGIINMYSRTPTLIAMSIATLDEISSRRAFLGLGTGGIGFIERGHGLKIEKPLERMREYIEIIRKLLKWERFSYKGKYFNIKDFRLRQKPIRDNLPIYIAGLNPLMWQLAGELADGIIVNMLTEKVLSEIKENIKIGAERAGRDPNSIRIHTIAMTLCGEDNEALEAMRKTTAFYAASPHYHHIFEIEGFREEAKKIRELWDSDKREEAIKLVSEEMLKVLTLTGSVSDIRYKIKKYISLGVYPIIYPIIRHKSPVDDVLYALKLGTDSL